MKRPSTRFSLHGRLMATTAIALGLFLAAAGWIWERLFTTNVLASAEEQMLIVAYSLVDATRHGNMPIPPPSMHPS